jgi:hypothetical protein
LTTAALKKRNAPPASHGSITPFVAFRASGVGFLQSNRKAGNLGWMLCRWFTAETQDLYCKRLAGLKTASIETTNANGTP